MILRFWLSRNRPCKEHRESLQPGNAYKLVQGVSPAQVENSCGCVIYSHFKGGCYLVAIFDPDDWKESPQLLDIGEGVMVEATIGMLIDMGQLKDLAAKMGRTLVRKDVDKEGS